MTPRRLLFAFLALSLSFAAPLRQARAEDEPAKEEPAKDEPAKEEDRKPLPDEDSKPVQDEDSKPAPKPKSGKKKASKKKVYDYDRSKYKSRELSQTPSYKFNDKGEPVREEVKKAKKKKKRSEPPEIEAQEGCGSADSCAEKKSEADAL